MKFLIFVTVIFSGLVCVSAVCKDWIPNCDWYDYACNMPEYRWWIDANCMKFCGLCRIIPPTRRPVTGGGGGGSGDSGNCGKPAIQGTRVIGGIDAVRGSWPWQILLTYEGVGKCGGALIAPQWVLTAAHCFGWMKDYVSRFKVRVGEFNKNVDEGTEFTHDIKAIGMHADYNSFTMQNDIAIVKLATPVQMNKYVSTVCIPDADPPIHKICYITGWGKIQYPGTMHHILQQAKLPVVTNEACHMKAYPALRKKVTAAMVCGGDGGTTTRSGCHGDSGGPYVCKMNGRWELHGVVSFGSGSCNSTETQTIFARVFYFKDWIRNKMATL